MAGETKRKNPDGTWSVLDADGKVIYTAATEAEADQILGTQAGTTTNRQRAIDAVKALAGGFGSPLAQRAENILAAMLQSSSEEAIGVDFAERNAALFQRIVAEAQRLQGLADAGDALQVFQDEYNRVFIQPLQALLLTAPTAREQALIKTALAFAQADMVKRVNEYDQFLATQGITDVTRSNLSQAAMLYFSTVLADFIRSNLSEIPTEELVKIEEPIRQAYLARAAVVRAEGQARGDFRTRLSTMTNTLNKLRNDPDFSEAERRALTNALDAILLGADRAEEQWIAFAGALDLETAVNTLVTRELQAATLQTPDLFALIVGGDAVGSLGALGALLGQRATAATDVAAREAFTRRVQIELGLSTLTDAAKAQFTPERIKSLYDEAVAANVTPGSLLEQRIKAMEATLKVAGEVTAATKAELEAPIEAERQRLGDLAQDVLSFAKFWQTQVEGLDPQLLKGLTLIQLYDQWKAAGLDPDQEMKKLVAGSKQKKATEAQVKEGAATAARINLAQQEATALQAATQPMTGFSPGATTLATGLGIPRANWPIPAAGTTAQGAIGIIDVLMTSSALRATFGKDPGGVRLRAALEEQVRQGMPFEQVLSLAQGIRDAEEERLREAQVQANRTLTETGLTPEQIAEEQALTTELAGKVLTPEFAAQRKRLTEIQDIRASYVKPKPAAPVVPGPKPQERRRRPAVRV